MKRDKTEKSFQGLEVVQPEVAGSSESLQDLTRGNSSRDDVHTSSVASTTTQSTSTARVAPTTVFTTAASLVCGTDNATFIASCVHGLEKHGHQVPEKIVNAAYEYMSQKNIALNQNHQPIAEYDVVAFVILFMYLVKLNGTSITCNSYAYFKDTWDLSVHVSRLQKEFPTSKGFTLEMIATSLLNTAGICRLNMVAARKYLAGSCEDGSAPHLTKPTCRPRLQLARGGSNNVNASIAGTHFNNSVVTSTPNQSSVSSDLTAGDHDDNFPSLYPSAQPRQAIVSRSQQTSASRSSQHTSSLFKHECPYDTSCTDAVRDSERMTSNLGLGLPWSRSANIGSAEKLRMLEQIKSVTRCQQALAGELLRLSGGNVEAAINLYLDKHAHNPITPPISTAGGYYRPIRPPASRGTTDTSSLSSGCVFLPAKGSRASTATMAAVATSTASTSSVSANTISTISVNRAGRSAFKRMSGS